MNAVPVASSGRKAAFDLVDQFLWQKRLGDNG
jgi:hypothetical protein